MAQSGQDSLPLSICRKFHVRIRPSFTPLLHSFLAGEEVIINCIPLEIEGRALRNLIIIRVAKPVRGQWAGKSPAGEGQVATLG